MSGEFCACAEPLTDDEVGVDGEGDWCWRCRRPIRQPEDEE